MIWFTLYTVFCFQSRTSMTPMPHMSNSSSPSSKILIKLSGTSSLKPARKLSICCWTRDTNRHWMTS